MRYSILHTTHIRYSEPIRESVMEVRKRPRHNDRQTLLAHELTLDPAATILRHTDSFGNEVQHFDLPCPHESVTVISRSLVEVAVPAPLPDSLQSEDWNEVDRIVDAEGLWCLLVPGPYTAATPLLDDLAVEVNARRRDDPLSLVLELNRHIHSSFEFVPRSTSVDSTIDVALEKRQGVCQDFAHLLIALARRVGLPARYVSGYLCPTGPCDERSREQSSHAWAEIRLPRLGWLGLDPMMSVVATGRHVRLAVGRDYTDVPPTRGVFQGQAESEIDVEVRLAAVGDPTSSLC